MNDSADDNLTTPLPQAGRVEMASTQVEMELSEGRVMTSRRFGELIAGWASEGDGGTILSEVWDQLVESSCGR
jgi:hypothetical protein